MRRYHFLLRSNPTYRYCASITPTSKQFFELCENIYARFGSNPSVTNYVLLQHDPKKPDTGLACHFSFDEIVGTPGYWLNKSEAAEEESPSLISVPDVRPATKLKGYQDSYGDITLHGETLDHTQMIGRPLCNIEWTPKLGVSQNYTFYAMKSVKKISAAPKPISRLNDSLDAKKIFHEKTGQHKECRGLKVKTADVPKRCAILNRNPDQNRVMGFPAVQEYANCAETYKSFLNPALTAMLLHVANIMHLSTLRSKDAKGIPVSDDTRKIAHRDRLHRAEWLHLMSYGLHPMNKDPQHENNLGAARACDNTRMMLLEYTVRWFALNAPTTKCRLSGRFDLLLDTDVIDTITLIALLSVNKAECKLTQKIDALLLNPELIHSSDLAGLITLISFLLQNKKPLSQVVEISSSTTLSVPTKQQFFEAFRENEPLVKSAGIVPF